MLMPIVIKSDSLHHIALIYGFLSQGMRVSRIGFFFSQKKNIDESIRTLRSPLRNYVRSLTPLSVCSKLRTSPQLLRTGQKNP